MSEIAKQVTNRQTRIMTRPSENRTYSYVRSELSANTAFLIKKIPTIEKLSLT
jgi:hypothetical protein